MKIDLAFAEEIVSQAVKKGVDEAEVFFKAFKNLSVDVKGQAVDSLSSSLSHGYSLRVIKNKRLGFAYATDLNEKDSVITQAVGAAAYSDEDIWLGLPDSSAPAQIEVYDPALADLRENDAISLARLLEKSAFAADSRIKKVRKASGSFTSAETYIVNSKSVRAHYHSTSCSAQIMAIAEDGQESQTGWDFSGSRFLRDVSFENTGRTAAERAVQLLGARTITERRTGIILDNSVAVDFLSIFASSFSSDSLQKGKSLLKDKLGKRIISHLINIVDSGLLPGKLGSSPVDAEGVTTREKFLVREGVLQGYLYNTYTARRGGTHSTGNAARGGFSTLPSVGITNLFIEPSSSGKSPCKKDLFKTLDRGLYIVDAMGVHTANPISGDFSVGVTGLWIEGGEIQFPVKEAVISGNILEFFSKVAAAGNDLTFYGSMGAPSLLISDVDVSA
ncbi:MAG: TldD/PmbA family protein [Nitrospirota bacterium]|nr:TldD/PmbA family protein [Nitrospirota bacterium]